MQSVSFPPPVHAVQSMQPPPHAHATSAIYMHHLRKPSPPNAPHSSQGLKSQSLKSAPQLLYRRVAPCTRAKGSRARVSRALPLYSIGVSYPAPEPKAL